MTNPIVNIGKHVGFWCRRRIHGVVTRRVRAGGRVRRAHPVLAPTSAMWCDHNRHNPYKLFEAVGRMDDRWRGIVGVCPAHGGVELMGTGLLHVRLAACVKMKPSTPYLCLAPLARRAHDIVSARRSDVAHPIFAGVVHLRVVFDLWWGQPRMFPTFAQHIVYLSVVGMTRAIAVDGRRVYGSRVRAWWWLEVVGRVS
jgi:hypothetical protein